MGRAAFEDRFDGFDEQVTVDGRRLRDDDDVDEVLDAGRRGVSGVTSGVGVELLGQVLLDR